MTKTRLPNPALGVEGSGSPTLNLIYSNPEPYLLQPCTGLPDIPGETTSVEKTISGREVSHFSGNAIRSAFSNCRKLAANNFFSTIYCVPNYEFRITSSELRIPNYEFRITNSEQNCNSSQYMVIGLRSSRSGNRFRG